MQTQSPGAQNCFKQQQAKQVTPLINLKVSTANVVADSRSELQTTCKNSTFKQWLQIATKVFHKDSRKDPWLSSYQESNKLLQRIKSSCQNSEKSRSTQTSSNAKTTQNNSCHKLLLGNSQKVSLLLHAALSAVRRLVRACINYCLWQNSNHLLMLKLGHTSSVVGPHIERGQLLS